MATLEAPSEPAANPSSDPGSGLRRHAARGVLVNSTFMVAIAGLALVQRLIVSRLLSPAQFGLWSVVLLAVLTVLFLKNAGIGDKFVQQDEADQERAFQKAFTIDLALAVACVGFAVLAIPAFALLYGRPELIAPGLVLSLAIIGNSLQAPVWVHYRQMEFARQRLLLAVDPVVTFVVTVALAALGAGVWSLVCGAVVGAFSGGAVALRLSRYRPRLVWERNAVREYFGFSWPVVVAGGSGMLIAQAATISATRIVGLGAAGGVGVAASISGFTDGVDGIVSQALYPAICAVRDQPRLLFESFVKSNRLALLWGMPFGIGVAVFAPDLVHFVIGDKWRFATGLIRAFGLVAAFDQIGFNWTAFLRALNLTRPMAYLSLIQVGVFFVVAIPLFVAFGLPGFTTGWLILGAATVASRTYYLKRLFPEFRMLRHTLRALLPSAAAVGAALAVKALNGGPPRLALSLGELGLYIAVTLLVSVACERALLAEVWSYLRVRTPQPSVKPAGL
jgi:O-antigen/teichoic acid export membrane protein